MKAVVNFQNSGWDRELIAKYDVPGPRYTSYPTAVEFTEAFGEADYRARVAALGTSIAPLSLYLHIPFCENICYYCACNKVITRQKEKARHYLNYLEKEIAMQGALFGQDRPVTQLHWGGGTPTYLSPAEMTELMHATATHFQLLDDPAREYSIEVDPRTVGRDTLALLKGLGFNRISMGVQDFNPQVQRAVNRIQPYEKVADLCEAVRAYSFKSLSMDLIYGLPYQDRDSLRATLEQVVGIGPDRISLYNYAHMPERFKTQRSIDRLTLPTASEKIAMLTGAIEYLTAEGYLYIGMDHFVRPDDDLAVAQREGKLQRNFQGYSTCLAPDMVGLGVSAIGSVNDAFAQNEKTLDAYYQRLDADQLPIWRGLALSAEDKLRRYVIMALICNLELDFAEVSRRFGVVFREHFAPELARLSGCARDGLLRIEDNRLVVTDAGRLMIRNICMVFDEYLSSNNQKVFSKTL